MYLEVFESSYVPGLKRSNVYGDLAGHRFEFTFLDLYVNGFPFMLQYFRAITRCIKRGRTILVGWKSILEQDFLSITTVT